MTPSKKTARRLTQSPNRPAAAPTPPVPSASGPILRDILLLLALGLAMRLPFLGRHGLYLDELYCLNDAAGAFDHIFKTAHPLHFLLLRPFARISDSEFCLRLLPALFNVLSLPVMYWIGRRALGRAFGVMSAAALVFSEYSAFYATDADYYSGMMLLSLLSLAAAQEFLLLGQWRYAALFVVASSASFLIHPFSGLFSGVVMLTALAIAAIGRETRRGLFLEKIWRPLVAAGLAGGAALAVAIHARKLIMPYATMFLRNVRWASWAHNLDFNGWFFYRTFKEYGPSLVFDGPAAAIATAALFLLFLAGLVRLARRRPALCCLILAPIVATFVMIFNTGIDRFYHVRYSSYIAPLYILGFVAGAFALGETFVRLGFSIPSPFPPPGPQHSLPPSPAGEDSPPSPSHGEGAGGEAPAAPISSSPLATSGEGGRGGEAPFLPSLVAAIAILLALAPFSLRLLTGPYGNWRAIMEELKPQWRPWSRLVVHGEPDALLARYYFERFGLDPAGLFWPRHHTRGQEDFSLFELKRTVSQSPHAFFVTAWREKGTTYPPLTDWARDNMTKVVEAPSRNEVSLIQYYGDKERREREEWGTQQAAALYAWPEKTGLLLFPYPLQFKADASGIVPHEILVDREGEYEVEARATGAAKDSAQLPEKAVIGGRTIPLEAIGQGRRGSVTLPAGPVRFALSIGQDSEEPGGIDADYSVALYPSLKNPLPLPLDRIHAIHPTAGITLKPEGADKVIRFGRKGFTSYAFYLPDDGAVDLALNTSGEGPEEAWEVWFDSAPSALLARARGAAVPDWRVASPALPRGSHVASIYCLTEDDPSARPGETGAGILRSASLSLADRAATSDTLRAVDAPIWAADGSLRRGWSASSQPRRDGNDTSKAGLRLDVRPDSKGEYLACPEIDLSGRTVLLGSIELRAQNMRNHSLNAMLIVVDAQGRERRDWCYAEGLTGDTDWITFILYAKLQPGDAFAVIVPQAYRNSNRPSAEPGAIGVRNLRWHR